MLIDLSAYCRTCRAPVGVSCVFNTRRAGPTTHAARRAAVASPPDETRPWRLQ